MAASNPKWLLPTSLTVEPHPFGHYRQKCGVDICLPREYEEGPPHVLGEHGTRGPGACPRDTGAKGRARAFRARAQRELSRKTIRFSCASSVALCEGTASLRTGRPLRPYSQGRLCHAHFVRLANIAAVNYSLLSPHVTGGIMDNGLVEFDKNGELEYSKETAQPGR